MGVNVKEMIHERLKMLATAQECMVDVADIMELWEKSQLMLEKSTFDSINVSDGALNHSKEGKRIVTKLLDSCLNISDHPDKSDIEAMAVLLKEAGSLFQNIYVATKNMNEIAHNLELEVACQREIAEHMKNHVGTISGSVNQAVACAEFFLAEL